VKKKATMMTAASWARFARICAGDAHENWFSKRRGTWYVKDLGVVVVFSNSPYADGPAPREEELAEFRERLRAEGINELAYATYPDDGYTYALILDAGLDQQALLVEVMNDIAARLLGGQSPDSAST
jgi:hypothetical protein